MDVHGATNQEACSFHTVACPFSLHLTAAFGWAASLQQCFPARWFQRVMTSHDYQVSQEIIVTIRHDQEIWNTHEYVASYFTNFITLYWAYIGHLVAIERQHP